MTSTELTAWHEAFAAQRYIVLESVLADPLLAVAYQYVLKRALLLDGARETGQDTAGPSFYADPLLETLLELTQSVAEAFSGLQLWPTFSSAHLYGRGAVIAPRVERPAGEIVLSFPLGYRASTAWPLHVGTPDGVQTAVLSPGDAVLVRGCECPQWRGSFEGDYHCQASFHFVDRNGPHAEWRFDKRSTLARPAVVAGARLTP